MVLAYDVHGEGEPILLIHGIGHRRQGWDPVVPLLADDFQVITIDLPGFGESGPLEFEPGHANEALREPLYATLEALGVEKPHVVGNSLGGLIALESGASGHASSVTAFSPAGFWSGELDFTYINALFNGVLLATKIARPIAAPVFSTALGRKLSMSWLNAHPERTPAKVAHEDAEFLTAAGPTVRKLLAEHYQFDGHIDVPVTIAWAEKDRVLLPYQARRAQEILPDAEFTWLPDCGHVPMWDDPQLVADTIRATVARATTTPTTKKKAVRA